MIITCEQCLKKFEIESSLIPKDGRLLECGSCNHKWFYKQVSKDKTKKIIILLKQIFLKQINWTPQLKIKK